MRRATVAAVLLLWLPWLRAFDEPWQPKLWKISSAGNTLYLLGSIHAGTPDMYPLPAPIEEMFAGSKVLLVEEYRNPAEGGGDAVGKIVSEKGFYPDHDSLWKHIGGETRKRLEQFLKSHKKFLSEQGMKGKDVAQLRPWAVALMVGLTPALASGMTGELGVDQHFKDEAEKSGKAITGIETAEFQVGLLASFPEKLQVAWLEAALGMRADGVAEVEKALVPDRNVHMAEVADEYLKRGGQVFVVVGSAHVEGDQGIVHLMEGRGYRSEVVPLRAAAAR